MPLRILVAVQPQLFTERPTLVQTAADRWAIGHSFNARLGITGDGNQTRQCIHHGDRLLIEPAPTSATCGKLALLLGITHRWVNYWIIAGDHTTSSSCRLLLF